MRNRIMTPNGNMVVVEGATRAQWTRRANGAWKLAGIWPDANERSLVDQHLQDGAGLLIVMDSAPGILSAFRDELDDPLLFAAATAEDFLVDVTVPFLDWLPARHAHTARLFQDQVREQTADLPAALQPPFILSDPQSSGSDVRFVARTPGSIPATVSDEHMCALADYVFSSREGRNADDARRPGSARWLSRLARVVAAGPKEPVTIGAGASHAV
jgi:hypothetical protein